MKSLPLGVVKLEGIFVQHQGGKPAGLRPVLLQITSPVAGKQTYGAGLTWEDPAYTIEVAKQHLWCHLLLQDRLLPVGAHVWWLDNFILTKVLAEEGPLLREFMFPRGTL